MTEPPDPNPAWQGNWQARVYQAIRKVGCETIQEYLNLFPQATYIQAAERLGQDVAAVQLQDLQFREARESDTLRQAAMDGIVRVLRDGLPKGWNPKSPRDSAAICAYGAWAGMVETGAQLENADALLSIWKTIEVLSPPQGWLPEGTEDPYLREAFEKHWPQGKM